MSLIKTAKQRWIGFRKAAGDVADLFSPKNQVEARLIHASGPNKGQVYKSFKGRNVITSWQSSSGTAPTSGRDLMRRLIAPPTIGSTPVPGSLSPYDSSGTDTGEYISRMVLGSGTSAEAAADTGLDVPLHATEDVAIVNISEVEFDPTDTYVTFVANWSEAAANASIGEVGLLSGRGSPSGTDYSAIDFLGRKTFSPFTKTDEFTLQIRWTLRF